MTTPTIELFKLGQTVTVQMIDHNNNISEAIASPNHDVYIHIRFDQADMEQRARRGTAQVKT